MSTISMSNEISEITTALVECQSKFQSVRKDARNSFGGYRFATLQNVMETTRPILVENGIAVTQFPTAENSKIGVITLVSHTSGQWLQHGYTMPLIENKKMNSAQEAGSVITYARRYAYAAALGLVIDEDTDATPNQQRKPASKPNPVQKTSETDALLPSQRKKFHAAGAALYGDEWDDKRAELALHLTKGKSKSSNDLSYDQLGTLISGFNEKLKARGDNAKQGELIENGVKSGAHI